jgi:hypothetical protein
MSATIENLFLAPRYSALSLGRQAILVLALDALVRDDRGFFAAVEAFGETIAGLEESEIEDCFDLPERETMVELAGRIGVIHHADRLVLKAWGRVVAQVLATRNDVWISALEALMRRRTAN